MGTQADDDDEVRFRNRFRDGPNDSDAPMQRKKKRVMDKPTGKYTESEKEKHGHPILDHAAKAIRGETSPQGSGTLAQRRKKVVDSAIDSAE